MEDLTIKKRALVKEWANKVNQNKKDDENEKFEWRVRGSPRSRLNLKKSICKQERFTEATRA